MSHTPKCQTRVEWTGNIAVHYSNPDQNCRDNSHETAYTEEVK